MNMNVQSEDILEITKGEIRYAPILLKNSKEPGEKNTNRKTLRSDITE